MPTQIDFISHHIVHIVQAEKNIGCRLRGWGEGCFELA